MSIFYPSGVTLSLEEGLNPDGVEIAEKGVSDSRKRDFYLQANVGSADFEQWKANANGVDLNKQFKVDWQQKNTVGKPHYSEFKGNAGE